MEGKLPINIPKLRAVLLALEHETPFCEQLVIVQSDNVTAVANISHQGRVNVKLLASFMYKIIQPINIKGDLYFIIEFDQELAHAFTPFQKKKIIKLSHIPQYENPQTSYIVPGTSMSPTDPHIAGNVDREVPTSISGETTPKSNYIATQKSLYFP